VVTANLALLGLAASALDLACPPCAGALEYEGLRKRLLPEVRLTSRPQNRNSQYALDAVACMHAGLRSDLLNGSGWWQAPIQALGVATRQVVHAARRLTGGRPPIAEWLRAVL